MSDSPWRKALASKSGNCAEVGAWRKALASKSGNCAEVGAWRKALASTGGNCAEVGAWRTSSASYLEGHCAEVGTGDAVVGVRDTKQAQLGEARTVLEFSPGAWGRFLTQVGQGSAE